MPEQHRGPVLVFDLDGTILRINSFPRWVLFLIGGRMPGLPLGRRTRLSLTTLGLLCRRKLGRLDHDQMARHLGLAWRVAAGPDPDRSPTGRPGWSPPAAGFTAALARHVRPNLRPLPGTMAAENRPDAIMATAASADYAIAFGRQLCFADVLATPSDRPAGQPLNAGACKRDRILDLLAARDWLDRPRILFTDHIDDLPLMRVCDLVCWFGPEHRAGKARAAAPETEFICCRRLRAETIAAITRLSVPPTDSRQSSRRPSTVS